MTEPTETTRGNFRRTHPNPLAETFAPGTEIQHLNPSVAEWRGTVAPEPDTRQFIRTRDMRVWGKVGTTTEVYVWWDNPSPWASPRGWFDAEVIAPVDAVDHAASIDVLRFTTRISNCLKRNGIRTVGELLAKRPEDLKDLTNFGDNALAEVQATLGEQDPPLQLKPTDVPLHAETVRVMAEYAGQAGEPS